MNKKPVTKKMRALFVGAALLAAFSMAFELAVYGFLTGFLYNRMPTKKINIYLSLIISMVAGRLVWGAVQLCCVGFDVSEFSLSTFWAGAVANALPGIIIQLVLIPVLVMALERANSRTKKL